MFIKICLLLVFLLIIFLGYISTRKSKFKYERSDLINSSPDKIFPYLIDFKLGGQWSPYEKMDPNMRKQYFGTPLEVDSGMEFYGNRDAGSGKLKISKIVVNESVEIRLTMFEPFKADNIVVYELAKEGDLTRFSWTMSGDGGFTTKLITFFIDCDKLVGDQFSSGIYNLKNLVENQK